MMMVDVKSVLCVTFLGFRLEDEANRLLSFCSVKLFSVSVCETDLFFFLFFTFWSVRTNQALCQVYVLVWIHEFYCVSVTVWTCGNTLAQTCDAFRKKCMCIYVTATFWLLFVKHEVIFHTKHSFTSVWAHLHWGTQRWLDLCASSYARWVFSHAYTHFSPFTFLKPPFGQMGGNFHVQMLLIFFMRADLPNVGLLWRDSGWKQILM